MKWFCLKCGRRNEDEDGNCGKCGLDFDRAITYPVSRRLRFCEECGHQHRDGEYCHVYTEAVDEDAIDDIDILSDEEEEDNDSDSSIEERQSRNKKNGKQVIQPKVEQKKTLRIRPLATPDFVKSIKYTRCNCKEGVPNDCLRYEPVPTTVSVEKIQIKTFMELVSPEYKMKYENNRAHLRSETYMKRHKEEADRQVACCLPIILSYLPFGLCSMAPQVSKNWNYGTSLYTEYIDVRNFVPWQVYRVHNSQVESIHLHNTIVYTSGDRKVIASDMYTGEINATVTRDSADLVHMFESDERLFISSNNGSTRSFLLTHTGKNMRMECTLWEHSRAVNEVLCGLPSIGKCKLHGMTNHICFMFSASEDRTVKVWSFGRINCLKSLSYNSLRNSSFRCLAQTYRHLFVGTTMSSVAVITLQPRCEREDVHLCNVAGHDPMYCLQITLKLPRKSMPSGELPWVTGLLAPIQIDQHTGLNRFPHLWATDSIGQLTIWHIPEEGLDFRPAYTRRVHNKSINKLVRTWKHAATISDDGCIVLHDLRTFQQVRRLDVREWSAYAGIMTSLTLDRHLTSVCAKEDLVNGGTLLLGTNYGEVVAISLGTTI